jgi:hypothetical protein
MNRDQPWVTFPGQILIQPSSLKLQGGSQILAELSNGLAHSLYLHIPFLKMSKHFLSRLIRFICFEAF